MAQLGVWHDSPALWSHALAVTRDNDFAHTALANLERVAGNRDQAVEHLSEVLRLRPGDAQNEHELAEWLIEAHRPQEACPIAVKRPASARSTSPMDCGWATCSPSCTVRSAQAEFDRILALDARCADAYVGKGLAALDAGHADVAARFFCRATALRRGDVRFLTNLAAVLAQKAEQARGGQQTELLDVLAATYAEAGL